MAWRWRRPADCRAARRLLQSYLDGEASDTDTWLVARHLAECDDCYAEAAAIRSLKEAVRRLGVAPNRDVISRLQDLLATIPSPPGEV